MPPSSEPQTGSLDDLVGVIDRLAALRPTDHKLAEHELAEHEPVKQIFKGQRLVIALAGPPASGKSTIAAILQRRLGPTSTILPMDGFHHDNDWLEARGLRHRKGAPDTFDVTALTHLLTRLRANLRANLRASPRDGNDGPRLPQPVAKPKPMSVPTFDRTHDRVVPDGSVITADHRIILVEGNYLLLDQAPWQTLSPLFDLRVMLEVPVATLRSRLEARWRDLGHDAAEIASKVDGNDLPNARLVIETTSKMDFILSTSPESA